MDTFRSQPEHPQQEYSRRMRERRRQATHQDRMHHRMGLFRLGVFLAGAVVAWYAFRSVITPWWLVLPAAAFLMLMILQERVLRACRRAERAAAFYERGLSRLEGKWVGAGEQGTRFLDPSHPYAEDLDLFGKGSLFELICTARTRMGESTLADWLKTPATPQVIRDRQAAVEELRGKLDLREDLSVLGADVQAGVNAEALSVWAAANPLLTSRPSRVLAATLALMTTALLAGWAFAGLARLWLLIVMLLEGAFALAYRRRVLHVLDAVERPGEDLDVLSQVLERLEREVFLSPLLVRLRRELDSEGHPPSMQIARLHRLIVLLDSRRNQLFAPIAALLLWGTQMAFAIEEWRVKSGPSVPRWLAAVGEMEALCSIAGYAYEHPADPFPVIEEGSAFFHGDDLAHPLIPEERCVRNDVRLGDDLRLLLVSGSNMSGKSTLLRTVGTNAILALAGAPVRAASLRLSPVSVGASIHIVDSLQAGSSKFYAEITRLRRLVDLSRGSMPLLFLFDELLHGTNSHDRRIGAEAVVRSLVERGAIGLLTTHDLALSHIADVLAPRAANVHFEDHIENGKIAFDYRLHPGIVRRSNALELMRSVGLEV